MHFGHILSYFLLLLSDLRKMTQKVARFSCIHMVYCNAKSNGGERLDTFAMLYETYYDRMYAFLYRLCADRSLTEDLAQETFLQAYQSFHRFRGECAVFTWLASIGKHVYLKHLKRNKSLRLDIAMTDVDALGIQMEDPADYMYRQDAQKAVRTMIKKLPKKYQDVVVLRIYAQLPFSEIALILKIRENSAKVIFFRAKKKMMEGLRHEFEL